MTETRKCPDCGAALPPQAPPGQCPACLFRIGLAAADGGLGPSTQPLSVPAPGEEAQAARPTMKVEPVDAPGEAVGQTIGRYKLLEKLGEGGGGVVYVAGQTEPVRRRVALKVIKLGMDTRAVITRFEAERQALAMMDHPNIAKVLDAGTTETGRPYFVMELVRGIRITDYCDQSNLPTKERLDLFIKVCQAIQHAHQKGIIHRDIKPSNILVTLHDGVPVPKVIDFGIAKATEGRLTDATVYTQLHQFMGTPAYMSPEQAEMSGLDIDTRSDIYSLGVLLYELLAGSTPFDAKELMSSGIDAMRKIIREKEPVRPSTRLATLQDQELTTTAKRRSAEAPKLIHLLQGDLDWIVMKCLEKDRARRYETANGLATDIKRHLSNEPVSARPPSTAYRFQKAFRRNKVAFTATAAVAVALVAGIGISTWQAVKARQARLSEQQQRVEAQAAQKVAESERARAERSELSVRQNAYVSDMISVQLALEQNDLSRARELLLLHEPRDGSSDLRGWEWRYYAGQCREDDYLTPEANPRAIGLVSCPLHGGVIVATEDGGIELWNVTERKMVARLVQEDTPIVALAGDAEGRFLASRTEGGGPVKIWDISDFGNVKLVRTIPERFLFLGVGHAISPRQKLVAVAASMRTIRDLFIRGAEGDDRQTDIWNFETGVRVRTLDFVGAGFSPDGRLLATAALNGPILIWFADTWEVRHQLAPAGLVGCLSFSPDSRWLVTANGEGELLLWDLEKGVLAGRFRGNPGGEFAISFAPDGRILATVSAGRIVVWEVATQREVFRLKADYADHSLTFSPDGRWLVTASRGGGGLRIWSTDSAAHAKPVGHPYSPPVVAPDNRTVAYGSADMQSELWDLHSGKVLSKLPAGPNPLGFTDGGKTLITATVDSPLPIHPNRFGGLKFWDVATRTFKHAWNPVSSNEVVGAVALSPDATLLATGGTNGTVILRNARTGEERQRWTNGSGRVWRLVFSPDSSLLAANGEGAAKLWHLKSGRELDLATSFGPAVDFSPDGKILAVGDGDRVRLWQTSNGEILGTLRGGAGGIQWLAFSQDGRTLATADMAGGGLTLWNLATLRSVGNFMKNRDPLVVSFTPDGETLLGGLVGELHAWTAPTHTRPLERPIVSPSQAGPAIPPRDPRTPVRLLDLSPNFNLSLDQQWHFGPPPHRFSGSDLAALPRGIQEFAGVRFDVRGLIQVGHHNVRLEPYPSRVAGIRAGLRSPRLHFLHSAINVQEKRGKVVGSYVIHFENGQTRELPIAVGRDVADWWDFPHEKEPGLTVAWTGQNEASRARGRSIRLFKTTWQNPLPDEVIESIDFNWAGTEAAPFLVAITLD